MPTAASTGTIIASINSASALFWSGPTGFADAKLINAAAIIRQQARISTWLVFFILTSPDLVICVFLNKRFS